MSLTSPKRHQIVTRYLFNYQYIIKFSDKSDGIYINI